MTITEFNGWIQFHDTCYPGFVAWMEANPDEKDRWYESLGRYSRESADSASRKIASRPAEHQPQGFPEAIDRPGARMRDHTGHSADAASRAAREPQLPPERAADTGGLLGDYREASAARAAQVRGQVGAVPERRQRAGAAGSGGVRPGFAGEDTMRTWKPIDRETSVLKVLDLMRHLSHLSDDRKRDLAEELVAEIWQLAQQEQMSLLDRALREDASRPSSAST